MSGAVHRDAAAGDWRSLALLLALALGLQVLVTLPVGLSGLRVAASDLALPFVAAACATWAWAWGRPLPRLESPAIWRWFIGAGCVLTLGLVISWWRLDELIPWALWNRWIGFGVLVVYFLAGAWMGNLFQRSTLRNGLRVLLLFAAVSVIWSSVPYVAYILEMKNGLFRMQGWLVNPNAFGCALAFFALLHLAFRGKERLFPRWLDFSVSAVLLTGVVLSGSRSAWLGLAAGAVFLLCARFSGRMLLRLAVSGLLGGILVLGLHVVPNMAGKQQQDDDAGGKMGISRSDGRAVYITRGGIVFDGGVRHRLRLMSKAMNYWRKAPLLGNGLGYFLARERQGRDDTPNTLHNTALWLITELGLVGLTVFLGLFVQVVRVLLAKGREPPSFDSHLALGAAAAVVCMAAASAGTDLLYQRHLWWLAGLALAVPAARLSTRPEIG
ncbi:O-antigen ligase family protein [Desulfohalovibrio reitneri]|uniref:O-antigen ligase family protein n=1 Tax=Desulfohalovibrio reitneri TaxID=1307759 RepID=UPI0004A6EFC5|nr:O-antigen ligase family protein [Desulfohalovibrio reitneri]